MGNTVIRNKRDVIVLSVLKLLPYSSIGFKTDKDDGPKGYPLPSPTYFFPCIHLYPSSKRTTVGKVEVGKFINISWMTHDPWVYVTFVPPLPEGKSLTEKTIPSVFFVVFLCFFLFCFIVWYSSLFVSWFSSYWVLWLTRVSTQGPGLVVVLDPITTLPFGSAGRGLGD